MRKHIRNKLIGLMGLTAAFLALLVFSASAETEGVFTYTVANDEATITQTNYTEHDDLMIPENLGGYPVTKLDEYCFRNVAVSHISIPKTVRTISSHAFRSFYTTTYEVDPDNPYFSNDEFGVLFNKDKTLLFRAGTGLRADVYVLPETVSKINGFAFHSCQNIEEIVLPSSLREIESQAFYGAYNLKKINFPEGLTTINDNCFVSCNRLERVSLPSSLSSIKYGAFTECSGLKEVVFSEGIEALPRLVFENDTSLERVYLPKSLTSIGSGVFGNCVSLKDICYAGSEEDWASVAITTASYFGDRPVVIDTCDIHYNVPVETYKNLSFENDNDILTFSGSGTIPGGWHYWDADKDTVTTVLVNGDYQAINADAFADYPELATVILNTDSTSIADGAFTNCPNLQAVLCFGGSSFGADAFSFDGTLKVYENADAVHGMTTSQENIAVVPYRFSDGTLQLLADVTYDSYEFFDTMAAFTLQYDNIQKLSFRRFTFDSIPMYYYPEENGGTQRIEDNTLVNGEMYPMIYMDGEATPVTFNALINGLADTSISSFYLISSDENHEQIKDTQISVKDDTESGNNGDSGFIGAIKKAMRWVITLLNKLFTIISKLGR